MTRSVLLSCLALAFLAGCSFARKASKPRENPAISREVEESFQKRWVDRRSGELVAQGKAADAARTQAEAEFRERYEFTQAAKKK